MQSFRRFMDTKKVFPEGFNALKYALAHSVVAIGVFHPYLR